MGGYVIMDPNSLCRGKSKFAENIFCYLAMYRIMTWHW